VVIGIDSQYRRRKHHKRRVEVKDSSEFFKISEDLFCFLGKVSVVENGCFLFVMLSLGNKFAQI
jgi:hypothetical protein